MKHTFPKVLVCAPQYDGKNYCFKQWVEQVKRLTYPNYDIFLADNSKTKDNIKLIEAQGIKATHIKQNKKGNIFTIRDAHNACAKELIEGDYEYMLHLETDVIPPIDIIERLLNNKRKICAGAYDIKQGSERWAMIQTDEPFHRFVNKYRVIEMLDEAEPLFFDGTVKKVYHAGLGCILIHKDIFKIVVFEAMEGLDMHPDTIFATRCFENNLSIFVDTTIFCEHLNTTWLGKN